MGGGYARCMERSAPREAGGTAEVITDPDRLGEIEGDWRSLAERRGNAFLTPEWYFAWLRSYGADADPAVIAVRAPTGDLRGVMPMARDRAARPRSLRFGGANLADHLHPVAASLEQDEEVAVGAAARLGAEISGWSAIVLDNVDVDAGWWRAMIAAAPLSLTAVSYRQTTLPWIQLPASWEAYLAGRSRNFRSQLGRKLRALEREHEVRFRRTMATPELTGDLETFFHLHDARWDTRGGSSSASELTRRFHADFTAAALKRGWLRLWTMEVDGAPVAAWYGWRLGERYSYYLAGFEPRWSDASVGLVLLAHTVREAIEEAASEYDLLLGEEAYKQRFATASRPVETVVLARSFHPIRVLAGGEAALWRAHRRLPPGIRERSRSVAGGVRRRLPSFRHR
jgi:CelD/BcsL family acetyltransferase involved in cellulose biosynthesis